LTFLHGCSLRQLLLLLLLPYSTDYLHHNTLKKERKKEREGGKEGRKEGRKFLASVLLELVSRGTRN
jgi:hypothetical protein